MKPIYIAIVRAVAGGAVLGLASFTAVWATTDELKTLVVAFGTPFIGNIVTRGAAEGWWDTVRK